MVSCSPPFVAFLNNLFFNTNKQKNIVKQLLHVGQIILKTIWFTESNPGSASADTNSDINLPSPPPLHSFLFSSLFFIVYVLKTLILWKAQNIYIYIYTYNSGIYIYVCGKSDCF